MSAHEDAHEIAVLLEKVKAENVRLHAENKELRAEVDAWRASLISEAINIPGIRVTKEQFLAILEDKA